MSKPIKLDTILLRKIRACIKGDIQAINQASTGLFHVAVERRGDPLIYRYTIEVKPDDKG